MEILIKGMEMPKPKLTDMATVYNAYVLVSPNGHATIVVENEDGLDSTEYLLVSVPPHGRLGDLDKLENGLRHMAKYQHGERQQGILGCCETIRMASTIIPPEEG